MSYDRSLCEALTDSEREAGCGPHLWDYEEDEYEIAIRKEKREKEREAREAREREAIEAIEREARIEANKRQRAKRNAEITNLIAGSNDNIQIQNIAIRKLFFENIDYMIHTYSVMESLPYDYIYVAKQKNCINILIKGYLKNDVGCILTEDIVSKINEFSDKIYANSNLDIVYDRVYKIQKFIHRMVDEKNGKDAHMKLCATTMRNILSSARLHLNLQDIEYKDVKSLIYLIEQSEQASLIEEKHPSRAISSSGIIYTHYKRSRDMKSLLDFGHFNIINKIFEIACMDTSIPTDNLKDKITQIYSDMRHTKKNENGKDKKQLS